jgi:hypothetical protein
MFVLRESRRTASLNILIHLAVSAFPDMANLAGANFSNCRIDGITIDGIKVEDALAAYRKSQAA